MHSTNVSSLAPSGIMPTSGASGHHDRSAAGPPPQHYTYPSSVVAEPRAVGNAALVNSRSSSAAIPASVEISTRCNYLEAVNGDLRRELDRSRADCSRLQLENSRLKELLNTHSFQNDYLRLQLEKSQSRNASMMHYDSAPEGQSQAERLEGQNAMLRATVQAKEQELASVQLKLVELQGRVQGFEEALMAPRPKHGNQTRPEDEAAARNKTAPTTVDEEALCELQSSVSFVASSVASLHHVVCVRHSEMPLGSDAGCEFSRRDCLQQRLNRVVEGNQESPAQARARGFRRPPAEVVLGAQRLLLQCETSLVKLAAHCLAAPQRLAQLQVVDKAGHAFSDQHHQHLLDVPARMQAGDDEDAEPARHINFAPHPTPTSSGPKRNPDSSHTMAVPAAAHAAAGGHRSSEYFSSRGRDDAVKDSKRVNWRRHNGDEAAADSAAHFGADVGKSSSPSQHDQSRQVTSSDGRGNSSPPTRMAATTTTSHQLEKQSAGSRPVSALPSRKGSAPPSAEATREELSEPSRPKWASSTPLATAAGANSKNRSSDDCEVQ